MKRRILTHFVAAAAGLSLPLSVFAQDSLDQTSSGTSGTNLGANSSATSEGGSYTSGGTFSGSANQSSQSQPGTFSGGIMVHNGEAYIVHRLQNEMSLPDGSKIQPNGIIRESDGSTRSIGSGKVLTLDGREMEAPFKAEESSSSASPGVFSSPNSPGSSTSTGGTSSTPADSSNNSNSGLPPTTSTQSSTSGQAGSDSSLTPTPAEQNDGSGLAPGSINTDPAQDYTD